MPRLSAASEKINAMLNLRKSASTWLILIVVVASALHFFQIGARSLWFDEAISASAAHYDLNTIATQSLDPMAPPLYFMLLSIWLRGWNLIGLPTTEVVFRSFSAVCSLLAILPIYKFGLELFNLRAGRLASAQPSICQCPARSLCPPANTRPSINMRERIPFNR